MANVAGIETQAGSVYVRMDDGSRLRAHQIPNGDWIISESGGPGPEPSSDWIWPFPQSTITLTYGQHGSYDHRGTDFGNPPAISNAPIPSICSGIVTYAGNDMDIYGANVVIVEHGIVPGYGVVNVMYVHMWSIDVIQGQAVDVGTIIGPLGSTGNSTGPHLHLQINQNGTTWNTDTVDPETFLAAMGATGG